MIPYCELSSSTLAHVKMESVRDFERELVVPIGVMRKTMHSYSPRVDM